LSSNLSIHALMPIWKYSFGNDKLDLNGKINDEQAGFFIKEEVETYEQFKRIKMENDSSSVWPLMITNQKVIR